MPTLRFSVTQDKLRKDLRNDENTQSLAQGQDFSLKNDKTTIDSAITRLSQNLKKLGLAEEQNDNQLLEACI